MTGSYKTSGGHTEEIILDTDPGKVWSETSNSDATNYTTKG